MLGLEGGGCGLVRSEPTMTRSPLSLDFEYEVVYTITDDDTYRPQIRSPDFAEIRQIQEIEGLSV